MQRKRRQANKTPNCSALSARPLLLTNRCLLCTRDCTCKGRLEGLRYSRYPRTSPRRGGGKDKLQGNPRNCADRERCTDRPNIQALGRQFFHSMLGPCSLPVLERCALIVARTGKRWVEEAAAKDATFVVNAYFLVIGATVRTESDAQTDQTYTH